VNDFRTSGYRLMSAESIPAATLLDRIGRNEAPEILDVRSPGEFGEGHVPGATNVPFTNVLVGSDGVQAKKSDTLVVYCGHGPRAWLAAEALRWRGYTRVIYLPGQCRTC
jgi:rhodanese-related sulfurtransferase